MRGGTIVCRIIASRTIVSRIVVSRLAGILLLPILLTGCAGKDKISSGILPIDKMKTIVWDMIQADVYTDLYMKKDSGRMARMETLQLYAQVLELHQVSREDFRKSFQFYSDRPDLSRELFDSVQSLGARDRAAHPPAVLPSAAPVPAKGGAPGMVTPGMVIPNRPGIRPAFNFQNRAPHGMPPNSFPGSHPPIPSSHPVPGAHPPIPAPHTAPRTQQANPALHPAPATHGQGPHSPSAHPASDSSTHHHRAPAISKPNTKDII